MATQVELDNVALVRRGFELFGAGDLQALAPLFDPAAIWKSAPLGVLGGNLAGRDKIFAMIEKMQRETLGTWQVVPSAYAVASDRVFVDVIATGMRRGRALETESVLRCIVGDGTIKEVRVYYSDYPASALFWA